jgi:uncharacterized protein YndB with AHSA1/START domain
METALIVKVDKFVNAPVSEVWRALTDPKLIKEYFFGTEAVSDWKKGSSLVFRGEWEGKSYEDKGTILEVIPNQLLKYNYWSNLSGLEDKPENYANITYQLTPEGNGTRLVIIQDNVENEEKREHSEKNWLYIMDSMEKLISSKS